MRLVLVSLGVIGLFVLGSPVAVLADHCGAEGLVTPTSGPAGTAFIIQPRLGDSTDLGLYRNGQLRIKVYLAGDRIHEGYVFWSKAGDEGNWEARAWLRQLPVCRSEAAFTVTGLPDTATDVARLPGASIIAPAIVVVITLALACSLLPRRARG